MDIEKWYPRTIPKPSAGRVRKMVEQSEVIFEGVEYDKASRFLGEYLSINEIKSEGFEQIVYIKKEGKTKSIIKPGPKPTNKVSTENKMNDKASNYDVAMETTETEKDDSNSENKVSN